jgi:membrane-bound lytic murein transglycosylase D
VAIEAVAVATPVVEIAAAPEPEINDELSASVAESAAQPSLVAVTAETDIDVVIEIDSADELALVAEAESVDVSESEAQVAAMASLADPSDYSVADDDTIEILAAETLGHYADWLNIRTQRLRDINQLDYAKPVVVGRRVKLDFSQVSAAEFTAQRLAHHRGMQDAFFVRYRVTDTTEHQLKEGESVWLLAQKRYKVPVWLLLQYNPDLDFGRVRPGMRILFPRIERVDHSATVQQSLADAS